jgi:hypothetical protein
MLGAFSGIGLVSQPYTTAAAAAAAISINASSEPKSRFTSGLCGFSWTADDNGGMSAEPIVDRSLASPGGLVALPTFGVLRARGADAAKFLHSQLTQDVLSLDAARARPAGYCSAKGRLLASFVMLRPQADEVLLVCSADLMPATLKRLSMFVLRAACRLDDASAEWRVWGVLGPAAVQSLGAPLEAPAWSCWPPADASAASGHPGAAIHAVRLPDADAQPRWLVLAADRPTNGASPTSLEPSDWAVADIRAGLPWVTGPNVEQFVPQMVNFELIDGVNFQKGCYPGQEVVARSQYRGTLKRRTQLFSADARASAGDEIFHSADAGQPAGRVVNAATGHHGEGGRHWLLAEVKIAALAGGELQLGAPGGPRLIRHELPYAVPVESEGGSAAA